MKALKGSYRYYLEQYNACVKSGNGEKAKAAKIKLKEMEADLATWTRPTGNYKTEANG